jgi:hypothetical protein
MRDPSSHHLATFLDPYLAFFLDHPVVAAYVNNNVWCGEIDLAYLVVNESAARNAAPAADTVALCVREAHFKVSPCPFPLSLSPARTYGAGRPCRHVHAEPVLLLALVFVPMVLENIYSDRVLSHT